MNQAPKVLNGLDILKDYKDGYTLEMLRDKYGISTALALDIIHDLTVVRPKQMAEARLKLDAHHRAVEIEKCKNILREL